MQKEKIDALTNMVLIDKRNLDYYECTLDKCLLEHKQVIKTMIKGLKTENNNAYSQVIKEFSTYIKSSEVHAAELLKTYAKMMTLMHPPACQ